MATHIYPTKICRNVQNFAKKKTAGANQKFPKTDVQIPKLPKILRKNILTVPNRTLSCKLQVKFKSNAKTSEQLSKLYIWEFLVKVINFLNAFPVKFYHLISF